MSSLVMSLCLQLSMDAEDGVNLKRPRAPLSDSEDNVFSSPSGLFVCFARMYECVVSAQSLQCDLCSLFQRETMDRSGGVWEQAVRRTAVLKQAPPPLDA